MNPSEALANVMMANFEAKRLEQIKMLVETTDNFQYRQFLDTKNNPKIVQILKDQSNTLLNEEHKIFLDFLSSNDSENAERIVNEISLLDSRQEVDNYLISKYASLELQGQIKEILAENNQLNEDIQATRQRNRTKI